MQADRFEFCEQRNVLVANWGFNVTKSQSVDSQRYMERCYWRGKIEPYEQKSYHLKIVCELKFHV
ncbi:hypothetical protein DTQ70_05175 [Runella sp. SP2]|nr:hypothetical protein DTQ70_05175 [Runella sp. SP2]